MNYSIITGKNMPMIDVLFFSRGWNRQSYQTQGNKNQLVHEMMMDSLRIHTATYIADTYQSFKKRINRLDKKFP